VLAEHQLDPSCLQLELTETALLDDSQDLASALGRLSALGVSSSLDDFGTGYSSLSHLRRFPIDIVKIDRAFVRDVTVNADDASIVGAIVAMARSLGRHTVAEGLETRAQASFLRRRGCDVMQGYLVSRPMPGSEFLPWLDQYYKTRLLGDAVTDEGGRTLLLLDDEPNILAALQRVFLRDGYHIVTATHPADAFELLATHRVGVIVSDQRMPVIQGVDFLRNVRKLYPETMRIVLTGYTDLASVTAAINDGAIYKFLTKPWDARQLRAHVADAFRQYELTREVARLGTEVRVANEALERLKATQ
jgi:FixJ family two-component response regulator